MINGVQMWSQAWPNLKNLFEPIDNLIASLSIRPAPEGQKGLIRFTNDYGIEIFKYPEADFFEMTVIKFTGKEMDNYEFAFNTPIPDLNLGFTEEDILRLCQQVSRLKWA
jgi:hypothetical protein